MNNVHIDTLQALVSHRVAQLLQTVQCVVMTTHPQLLLLSSPLLYVLTKYTTQGSYRAYSLKVWGITDHPICPRMANCSPSHARHPVVKGLSFAHPHAGHPAEPVNI